MLQEPMTDVLTKTRLKIKFKFYGILPMEIQHQSCMLEGVSTSSSSAHKKPPTCRQGLSVWARAPIFFRKKIINMNPVKAKARKVPINVCTFFAASVSSPGKERRFDFACILHQEGDNLKTWLYLSRCNIQKLLLLSNDPCGRGIQGVNTGGKYFFHISLSNFRLHHTRKLVFKIQYQS